MLRAQRQTIPKMERIMVTISINVTGEQRLALRKMQARLIENYPDRQVSLSAVIRMIIDDFINSRED